MGVSARGLRLGLALCAVAALAGCDKPKPRNPPPAEAAATAPQAAEPAPLAPAWSAELMGKPMRAAFPNDGTCVGNTDNVQKTYAGPPAGTQIVGWGWDDAAKAPIARVVLVDKDLVVIGAGETGLERPDVVRARPNITSNTTGWSAMTGMTKGALDTYGVLADGKSVCKLGHIEF
jgi:hypothetical protein